LNQEEYEDRLSKMQRLHKELEDAFLEVNKIIPYDQNNREVYSPRFVFILQDASRQVDGMLKLLYRRLEPILPASATAKISAKIAKKRRPDFLDYYSALNYKGMLKAQKLALREYSPRVITPFVLTTQNSPQWWQAYNDTKHELPDGETFGKLGFVIDSLAAVAALHDIAELILNDKQLQPALDGSKWQDNEEYFMREYVRTRNKSYQDATVSWVGGREYMRHKSAIFYYLTQF
jgi:hypothetical protein